MRGISESRIRELVRFGKRVPRLVKLYKKYRKALRQVAGIEMRIAALEGKAVAKGGRRGKRRLSPSARRRISQAQKRRWAKHRKAATA